MENRLEAVYTGNAYNKTLQMAAAYDGDGNRVYQVNYNPEKDEDFSCYYRPTTVATTMAQASS